MDTIYFDNASTSFPKPQQVLNEMFKYMNTYGGSANRGSSSISMQSSRAVFQCRYELSKFFNYNKSENVIFTNNITSSINILLYGLIKPNWHVITTAMDHNSVLRPLLKLKNEIPNVEVDILPCNSEGFLDIETLKNSIKDNTKLIILSHASNLVGTIQPIAEIGRICKEKEIYFILDTAQTAGVLPIDMTDLNINALAFTGHKSLLGPQGIGGFIIDDNLNEVCNSVFVGGTGSQSSLLEAPTLLPDKFESGTLNVPGIVGLLEGIKFINDVGISNIREKEDILCKKALEVLLNMNRIKVYGTEDLCKRTSTISFNIDNVDPAEVGYILDSQFNIACRTGLHCAPLAHKTVGSYPNGSVRVSFGYFNELNEIEYFLECINKIK